MIQMIFRVEILFSAYGQYLPQILSGRTETKNLSRNSENYFKTFPKTWKMRNHVFKIGKGKMKILKLIRYFFNLEHSNVMHNFSWM